MITPDKRGGVVLHGRWVCQRCVDIMNDPRGGSYAVHNEDDQCGTPGCECPDCDYRGSNYDGE